MKRKKTLRMSETKTKYGTTTVEEKYVNGEITVLSYEGELNQDGKPHGRGTTTSSASARSFCLDWNNGIPVVGCKISMSVKEVMKFEGELVSLGTDSDGLYSTYWTLKGTAMFEKLSGTFVGTMTSGMSFIDGVFRTGTLVISMKKKEASLDASGKYTCADRNIIVDDLYNKRTYYLIDKRFFFNRAGVTYVFSASASQFLKDLYLFGTIENNQFVVSENDIYGTVLDKYVPDFELRIRTFGGF